MSDKATKARLVQLAGLIEREARALGLIGDGDAVYLEPGSKINGINWGIFVTYAGQHGRTDTLGLGHLSRDLSRAIDRAEGYLEALRVVNIARVSSAPVRRKPSLERVIFDTIGVQL